MSYTHDRFRMFLVLGAAAMLIGACAPIATAVPAAPAEGAPGVPAAEATLLPHALYFLANDAEGSSQIQRMERDGTTVTQLTHEPAGVTALDVSPVDGSLAYEAQVSLVLANADGSNRRVLVERGAEQSFDKFFWPVFSPDGRTLAYGDNGLVLHDLSAASTSLVLENQTGDALPGGTLFPIESYWPEAFSPDGKKLLVALGHWEMAPSHAVYDLATGTLVRYAEPPDYIYCCSFHGGPAWGVDGASFFGVASAHDFAYKSGEIWQIDAATGAVTRSLQAGEVDLNLPKELFAAPDGMLYYFIGTYAMDSGYFEAPELRMVRADPADLGNPTVLRADNFALMREALWAPDASFAIIASAPDQQYTGDGGVLELWYAGEGPSPIHLAGFGANMQWGP